MPVQFDQLLTSLQSDTREDLKTLLDEYGKGLDKGGAEAFNRSIPLLEERLPRHGDRQRGHARRDRRTTSPTTSRARATVGAALDRNSGQLKSLITDFNTTADAFAVEQAT